MKKIVFESLFEFKRHQDPGEALELGRLKKIEEWLRPLLFRQSYTINSDWEIDIKKDFIVANPMNFPEEIPEFIQFGNCGGSFMIRNRRLNSLRGCPHTIKKDFMVDSNKIKDLDGCPETVGGDFYIQNNDGDFTEEQVRKICQVAGRIKV